MLQLKTGTKCSQPEPHPGSSLCPAGPTLEIQLCEQRPQTALMGKSSTATVQSLQGTLRRNSISTAVIGLCGFIYTSGQQTPQLAPPHIHLRATRGGARLAEQCSSIYWTIRRAPDPVHLAPSSCTPLVPAALLGSG